MKRQTALLCPLLPNNKSAAVAVQFCLLPDWGRPKAQVCDVKASPDHILTTEVVALQAEQFGWVRQFK